MGLFSKVVKFPICFLTLISWGYSSLIKSRLAYNSSKVENPHWSKLIIRWNLVLGRQYLIRITVERSGPQLCFLRGTDLYFNPAFSIFTSSSWVKSPSNDWCGIWCPWSQANPRSKRVWILCPSSSIFCLFFQRLVCWPNKLPAKRTQTNKHLKPA